MFSEASYDHINNKVNQEQKSQSVDGKICNFWQKVKFDRVIKKEIRIDQPKEDHVGPMINNFLCSLATGQFLLASS